MKNEQIGSQLVSQNGPNQPPSSPAVDALTPAQQALHRNYLDSVKTMKASMVRAAFYLEKVATLKIHRLLGFKKIGAYAATYGGFTVAQTERLLHLARRLPDYPAVRNALENQGLSWGKARAIVSATDPKDQVHWLDLAQSGGSVRDLVQKITETESRLLPEAAPGAPAGPARPGAPAGSAGSTGPAPQEVSAPPALSQAAVHPARGWRRRRRSGHRPLRTMSR